MVTARSYEEANALAERVTAALKPLLLGDPIGLKPVTRVEPDAPSDGSVMIATRR